MTFWVFFLVARPLPPPPLSGRAIKKKKFSCGLPYWCKLERQRDNSKVFSQGIGKNRELHLYTFISGVDSTPWPIWHFGYWIFLAYLPSLSSDSLKGLTSIIIQGGGYTMVRILVGNSENVVHAWKGNRSSLEKKSDFWPLSNKCLKQIE